MSAPIGYLGACGSGSGSGGGCVCVTPASPIMRFVQAEILSNIGGNPAKMLAWLNAFDITTVPWGSYVQAYFSDYDATDPTPNPPVTLDSYLGVLLGSLNLLQGVSGFGYPNCTFGATSYPIAARGQALLPDPTAYYILAYGSPMGNDGGLPPYNPDTNSGWGGACGQAGGWIANGCIYAKQADADYPLIVDLPVPDATLNGANPNILVQNYYLGLITPGAGYRYIGGSVFVVQQDLHFTAAQVGMNGIDTTTFNAGDGCDSPADDPFGGDAP